MPGIEKRTWIKQTTKVKDVAKLIASLKWAGAFNQNKL